MTFCGTKDDEIPRPKRNLQRTPPRAKQPSPPRIDAEFVGGGGGLVSRDEPSTTTTKTKATKGPVQRSPPRKSPNPSSEKKKPDERNYDYLDSLKVDTNIERKDKLKRSPVDPNRNNDIFESPPAPINMTSEKHESIPLNLNPLKAGNEYIAQPDFYDPSLVGEMSPTKSIYKSPQTQRVQYATSELNNFEDRVDGLLSETRSILDDYTPKTDTAQAVPNGLTFQKAMSYNAQDTMSNFSQNEPVVDTANQNMMPGMVMPQNVAPGQVYRQNSYPMTYYAPVPMQQNVMPAQGYIQPQPMYAAAPAYPQDMNPSGMSPGPYQPQMVPANMMPANGQPMYQVFYPQQNAGAQPGQFNGPY